LDSSRNTLEYESTEQILGNISPANISTSFIGNLTGLVGEPTMLVGRLSIVHGNLTGLVGRLTMFVGRLSIVHGSFTGLVGDLTDLLGEST
jgi:hypothetical protein